MLHKGDKFQDADGTVFQIFSAIDDTYTYYFVANMKQHTIVRMLPKDAEMFVKGMRMVN